MEAIKMQVIAKIHNDYKSKFGIPRQSGLVNELHSAIVFEPEFRNADALRGLEDFSHLWLIWHFSEATKEHWSPTVRPPRLGGNARLGVFATRSPFRPNPLGLSSVKIISIEHTHDLGPVIYVAGADLMDGTPIFDIKPYLPYSDCHSDAAGGFTSTADDFLLKVVIPPELLLKVPPEKQKALIEVLSHDPRPSYQKDSDRIYGITFGENNVRFTVNDGTLTVCEIH